MQRLSDVDFAYHIYGILRVYAEYGLVEESPAGRHLITAELVCKRLTNRGDWLCGHLDGQRGEDVQIS